MAPSRSVTKAEILARWADARRCPVFVQARINDRGERSPHGDILHVAGFSDPQIWRMEQREVLDLVTAMLGITRFEAVLLDRVSGRNDGTEQAVLFSLPRLLGPRARHVVALMRHIEQMDAEAWAEALMRACLADPIKIEAGRSAILEAVANAGVVMWGPAHRSAWTAALDAVWLVFDERELTVRQRALICEAAKHCACAVDEVIGSHAFPADTTPHFLPLFGFPSFHEIPMEPPP